MEALGIAGPCPPTPGLLEEPFTPRHLSSPPLQPCHLVRPWQVGQLVRLPGDAPVEALGVDQALAFGGDPVVEAAVVATAGQGGVADTARQRLRSAALSLQVRGWVARWVGGRRVGGRGV